MAPLHSNERLKEESEAILARGERIASAFYGLEEGVDLKEITETLLTSDEIKESVKETILTTGRRFFLFTYPSDGFQVKGYLSFIPDFSEKPLLLLLRGGNKIFGLMAPATDLSCMRDYTVLATTYRGGVSEGVDEYGGSEVHDVPALMEYFPLSGLLDMQECIDKREDLKEMFSDDFGLILGENDEEWIKQRDPLEMVSNIRSDLPFLILQGTSDIRVGLEEGYNMVKKLEENGNPVTYLEVPEGDHCLGNQPDRTTLIADWFES